VTEIVVFITWRCCKKKLSSSICLYFQTIPIAQNATSSGSCGVEGFATQILNITDGDVRLDWTFDKNGDKFNVTNIAITYNQSVAGNCSVIQWR
jgi:hypothetical protein